jgi:hypothetical protein
LTDKSNCGGRKMKLSTDLLTSLVESRKPVDVVGNHLLGMWLEAARTSSSTGEFYYEGETQARALEDFILKAYPEFYNSLARECTNERSLRIAEQTSLIVMDGMSLREGVLIFNALKSEEYEITLNVGLSAVPSDTIAFRESMKISMSNFKEITNARNIKLAGDEKYVWSRFPDVILDKIQVGRTVISSLEEMYETTRDIAEELLRTLKAKKIVILSDHGYIRSESGFVFGVPDKVKSIFQKTFGSARYIQMDDVEVGPLLTQGYVEEFGGYYLAKSRYIWPVKGKFNIYLHGGLSLMECFTPIIRIKR